MDKVDLSLKISLNTVIPDDYLGGFDDDLDEAALISAAADYIEDLLHTIQELQRKVGAA